MMKLAKRLTRHAQSGFTVIELLIATAIFSVVLLMVTFGVMQITRVYYQGITETNTQNTARSVVDDISQAIQFGGTANIQQTPGSTPGTSYGFCVGNQLYSYVLGYQVVDAKTTGNQAFHGLVATNAVGCGGPVSPVANLITTQSIPGGRELIGQNMRLSKLSVTPVSGTANLWDIDVKVVYGDDDLLTSPTHPGNSPAASKDPDAECYAKVKGTQFCAVSEFNTIVEKRVE